MFFCLIACFFLEITPSFGAFPEGFEKNFGDCCTTFFRCPSCHPTISVKAVNEVYEMERDTSKTAKIVHHINTSDLLPKYFCCF